MTEQPLDPCRPAEDANEPSETDSRRGLLSKGAKLALAAPAVLLALQTGTALADSDSDADDQGQSHGHGKGHGHHADHASQAVPLCKVGDVAGGNDFTPTNGGTDPLRSGRVRVFPTADQTALRVQVSLRGAQPNTTYGVSFARFNDHVRESLGTITTDAHGHAEGFVNNLSGLRRIGAFVIQNGANDEFVSCLHA